MRDYRFVFAFWSLLCVACHPRSHYETLSWQRNMVTVCLYRRKDDIELTIKLDTISNEMLFSHYSISHNPPYARRSKKWQNVNQPNNICLDNFCQTTQAKNVLLENIFTLIRKLSRSQNLIPVEGLSEI